MTESNNILIMKFGGASVESPKSFSHVADLIIERLSDDRNIVVVVSAMRGVTDSLIALANEIHPSPPRREYDMLVSAGERISIALLAMALAAKNQEAVSFTGSQTGIITTEDHSQAKIVDVKPYRLLEAFKSKKVAIVAGFQGMSRAKEITTLGRGGSDTTAVALGVALLASKVEFFKDVEGIYEEDPRINASAAIYKTLTFERAIDVVRKTGGKVVHERALLLAQKNHLALHIRSFNSAHHEGTLICSQEKKHIQGPIYE